MATPTIVLALIPDDDLRALVRTVCARAGINVEPVLSIQACLTRLKSNGVGIVLVDDVAPGIQPDSDAVSLRAAAPVAHILFLTNDEHAEGPSGAAMYCKEELTADPQRFVDALKWRLESLCTRADIATLRDDVKTVSACSTRTEAAVTALVTNITPMIDKRINDNVSKPGFLPGVFKTWFAGRDYILWTVILLLGRLLWGVTVETRDKLLTRMAAADDVPAIRSEISQLKAGQTRMESTVKEIRDKLCPATTPAEVRPSPRTPWLDSRMHSVPRTSVAASPHREL